MTGLSSRALRLLGLLVLAGIAAGTVAALGGADPGCPEERYGCATSHEGEPVVLGILVTTGTERAVGEIRGAIDERGARFLNRPLHIRVEAIACDPAEGTEAARDLATDPLDDAPAFAVIAGACPPVLFPAAQILGDSAVPLVTLTTPEHVPAHARSLLDGSSVTDVAELTSLVLGSAEELAVRREDDLLVPRIPLVETLAGRGLRRPA